VGEMRNGVYYLKLSARGICLAATDNQESSLWHRRLGHPFFDSLSALSASSGFKLYKEFFECCDVCHRAKQIRSLFPISSTRANKPFSLIHCDLWGKYHTASLSGCHYFMCIVDDFSRAVWVFLLKNKSET